MQQSMESALLAIIRSSGQDDATKQKEQWREIASATLAVINVIDINGLGLENSIAVAIENSNFYRTDNLVIDNLAIISDSTKEIYTFLSRINDLDKHFFWVSFFDGETRFIELKRAVIRNMSRIVNDDMLNIDEEDLFFLLTYLSEDITVDNLVDYLDDLRLSIMSLADDEISSKFISQDIRRAAIMARLIQKK